MKQTTNTYAPIQQVRDVQPIRATCFHPTGEVYVVGTNTKALKICKYPDENERRNLISVHSDSRYDISENYPSSFDNYTNNNEDSQQQQQHHQPLSPREPTLAFTCLHIHCGSVYCCSFNQEGNLLATGSNDQVVHVIKYNADKHKPDGSEYKLSHHSGTIRDLSFMRGVNSSYMVSAGAGENEINVTDCNAMKLTQTFRGHESTIMSLNCFNNSNNTFASGSLDGTIRLWDLRSRQSVLTLTTPLALHSSTIGENNNNNNEQYVGSPGSIVGSCNKKFQSTPAESDSVLVLADHGDEARKENRGFDDMLAKHQQNLEEARHHQYQQPAPEQKGTPVGVVRVDPTDRLLVSGHKDGTCMLHDIRSNQLIQVFQAHENEIRTLNFSPNAYYLLTASYDHKVKLTDLQGHLDKKLPSVELAELDDKVVQTAWHPVDYNFVTTCADGSATLWTIPDFDNWIDSISMN